MSQKSFAGVDYDLLRTFVVAARASTFGQAAVERHVSVSAISQQIRALEAQLGVALFERLGRRVRLSEVGRALLERVSVELSRVDQAIEAALAGASIVRGRVALGAPRSFAQHWLLPRLPALLLDHPELALDLELGVPSLLEPRLSEGSLDLAILGREPSLTSIEAVPIARETFVAVASRAHLAREGTPRTLDEFAKHPWIVFDRDLAMHAPWWRASFGARARAPARLVCAVPSLEHMLALAEAGVGLAVLPDYLIAQSLGEGRVVEVRARDAKRSPTSELFLASRKGVIDSQRLRVVRDALARAPRAT